jgi:hypothetical protein
MRSPTLGAADVLPVFHRSLGGKITWIDAMTRDEIEAAIARAPWEWSADQKGFAPWPSHAVRGEPVIPASLADTPRASAIWKRK